MDIHALSVLKDCFGDESVKEFFCSDMPPGGVEKKGNRRTIVNRKRKDNRLTRKLTELLVHYSHMCKNPVMSRNNSTAVTESTIVTNLGAFLDSARSQD